MMNGRQKNKIDGGHCPPISWGTELRPSIQGGITSEGTVAYCVAEASGTAYADLGTRGGHCRGATICEGHHAAVVGASILEMEKAERNSHSTS